MLAVAAADVAAAAAEGKTPGATEAARPLLGVPTYIPTAHVDLDADFVCFSFGGNGGCVCVFACVASGLVCE